LRRGPKPPTTCEEKTYRYRLKHGHRNNVSCREIAKEIKYSRSSIVKTKAWKGYQRKRRHDIEQNRNKLLGNQDMDDDFIREK